MKTETADSYFLITYRDQKDATVVQLKARRIDDSSLGLGFVRVSEFLFETSGVVVKPSEEQLQRRLENTKSLHLSIYTILAVEEKGLNHQGLSFQNDKSNLIALPLTTN